MKLHCQLVESNPLSWEQSGLFRDFYETPLVNSSTEYNPGPCIGRLIWWQEMASFNSVTLLLGDLIRITFIHFREFLLHQVSISFLKCPSILNLPESSPSTLSLLPLPTDHPVPVSTCASSFISILALPPRETYVPLPQTLPLSEIDLWWLECVTAVSIPGVDCSFFTPHPSLLHLLYVLT